jgi:hypothetical protein
MPRAFGITNAAPYASAPAVGVAGDTYWNTTTKVLSVSDGTAWIAVGSGAAGQVHARVSRAASFPSIASGANVVLTFDTIADNTGGLYAAGQPDRFTIQAAGFYLFGGWCGFGSATTGLRRIIIALVNSVQLAANEAAQGAPRSLSVDTGALLAPGDVVQIAAYQDTGTTLALTAEAMYIYRGA